MHPSAKELHARVAERLLRPLPDSLLPLLDGLLGALDTDEPRARLADELLLALLASGEPASTLLVVLSEAVALLAAEEDADPLQKRALGLAIQAFDFLEHRHRDEVRSLVRRVRHDPITGLPNRRSILDELAGALARSHRLQSRLLVALIGVAAPHDTTISDTDLIELATRLEESGRAGDLVGRAGERAFLVAREAVEDPTAARRILARIASHAGAPLPTTHVPDLRIVATLADGERHDPKRVLESLERALANVEDATPRLLEIATSATNPTRAPFGPVELRYQPIVRLTTGAIVRVEALARFPVDGELRPPGPMVAQLDSAERRRLLEDVLRGVARDMAAERLTYPVSVNLEPDLISRRELARWIDETWRGAGLDPGLLTLEITETQSLYSLAVEPLGWLRARGYQLALDDFGTGYASLSRVLRFEFSQYKLDRLFSDPVELIDRGLVLLVVATEAAALLGAELVVEGVEDLVSLTVLRTLELPLAQGFLLAPPLAIDALVTHPPTVSVEIPEECRPVRDAVRLFRWERAALAAHSQESGLAGACPVCALGLPPELAALHERQHALLDDLASGHPDAARTLTRLGRDIRIALLALMPGVATR